RRPLRRPGPRPAAAPPPRAGWSRSSSRPPPRWRRARRRAGSPAPAARRKDAPHGSPRRRRRARRSRWTARRSQRDVPVLLGGQRVALGAQRAQRVCHLEAGVGGTDHAVDPAALGRGVRSRELLLVLGLVPGAGGVDVPALLGD